VEATEAAKADQELLADEPATPLAEDRRKAGQARSVLLAAIGRGSSQPQTVPRHALADLGVASTWRVGEIEAPGDLVKKKI